MFQYRPNSRKPSKDFYNSFREAYPNVHIDVATSSTAANSSEMPTSNGLTADSSDQRGTLGQSRGHSNDDNPTLERYDGLWMLTPPLFLWNSSPLFGVANQPPSCYVNTAEATSALHRNQYGGLHAPKLGMEMDLGLGATLLLPASDENHFELNQPFALHQYPPQPSCLEAIDVLKHRSPSDENDTDRNTMMHDDYLPMDFSSSPCDRSMPVSPLAFSEKFRSHVTLNASTSMIEQADETPVTYLNKGHAYSVSIAGIASLPSGPIPVQYRTSIWISFREEQQRRRPAIYWQLWKDFRGAKEAHHCGSKLGAVEYVEAERPVKDDNNITQVDLEATFLDGFSVLWAPGLDGSAGCTLAVKFHFLSTDFKRAKGVKGILNRLCVKTEVVPTTLPHSPQEDPEICFCHVQLFRDHGAERKSSHNTAHVKKAINKLKQQIAQFEARTKEDGKTDRTWSAVTNATTVSGPTNALERKRARSTSSASSARARETTKAELYSKLRAIQDKSTSARSVSALCLRGQGQDDHDPSISQVNGEHLDLTRREPVKSADWQRNTGRRGSFTGGVSSLISPSASSASLQPQGNEDSGDDSSTGDPVPTGGLWNEFQPVSPSETRQYQSNPQNLLTPPDQPLKTRIQTLQKDSSGKRKKWIEVLETNPSYRSPPKRSVKPVACFYFLYRGQNVSIKNGYYRAVYLMKHNAEELVTSIAAKCNVEATKICQTVHVNQKGFAAIVDDNVVRGLPEGQDMIVEFSSITRRPAKREWDSTVDSVVDSGEISREQNVVHLENYELRLIF